MPETMKQEALQLERSHRLGVMELVSFPTYFLWRSRLTTSFEATKLTHVHDVFVVKSRQSVISNNKLHTFLSLMVNCSLKDISKGIVNLLQL